MKNTILLLTMILMSSLAIAAAAEHKIEITDNQLHIDGEPQPQLFGGELQYFRLRGGYGPNVPRQTVIDTWNRALDKVVAAHMNAISFYIPWDFHEYAEGRFDFDGTVDEDGDGNPDYPSRDVKTFFKLAAAHGIKRILVRPGPYINAEWGYFGFGAIPIWFHQKYPNAHMQTSYGWPTKLYDYLNPDLLTHTKLWFTALYNQVLKDQMGPGKPIVFLQVDNETNYQWQTIYNLDYSPAAVARYQQYLQDTYKSIPNLNVAHNRQWAKWSDVKPPILRGVNLAEDQEWYKFADLSMFKYLHEIRSIWENDLGVREPQIQFTLAESYNAADNGVLPNYIYRNSKQTGLMTVNLYPKTFDATDHTLLNQPFKADLDVKSANEGNDRYFGSHQDWVMGPEIQGGWWAGTHVTPEARQQTYLTVIGHGMKSMFVYYFNEGYNWGVGWAASQIRPLFEALKVEWKVTDIPVDLLSNEFWGELQARCDHQIMVGFDARGLMQQQDPHAGETLYFDSPLDGNANEKPNYANLKNLGEKIIAPNADFLGRSVELYDDVAFLKDDTAHLPNDFVNSVWAASDWSAGLLGWLLNSDVNPKILLSDISTDDEFLSPKAYIHVDTGVNAPPTRARLATAYNQGRTIINFLDSNATSTFMSKVPTIAIKGDIPGKPTLTFYDSGKPYNVISNQPLIAYDLSQMPDCHGILFYGTYIVGYQCHNLIQIGALMFVDYNSSDYAQIVDSKERRHFMHMLLDSANVHSNLRWSDAAEKTVAFARVDPLKNLIWVTVKTGSETAQSLQLTVDAAMLAANLPKPTDHYVVTDLLGQTVQTLSLEQIATTGFQAALAANASTVFKIEAD